jgi:ribosomal protein S18 acetylase RimI-like enzyme
MHRPTRSNPQLRRTTLTDLDTVYALITEAANWLQSRNSTQWSFFLTHQGKDLIRHRIETAETYLVLDPNAQPIATFTIQWDDEKIWGSRGLDKTAGYVHGLAVSRRAAGNGIGLQMLDWSCKLIAQKSRPLVRLDCMADNAALCNYYRRAGFTDAGKYDVVRIGSWERLFVQLFERSIDPGTPSERGKSNG